MLVSMTGFGSAAVSNGDYSVKVEVRAVNHRYSDISIRLPKGFQSVEDRIRRLVGGFVERGRTEIFVAVEEFHGKARTVTLDKGLLEGYRNAFLEASEALGQSGSLTLDMLPGLQDLFRVEEAEVDFDAVWPLIESAVREALGRLVEMRTIEGGRLEADMLRRLLQVEDLFGEIARRSPEVVEGYRRRLAERIEQALQSQEIDEQRLAQEAAFFADKSNIDEEVTRARSHIEQFRSACASGEAVGRKLDFLLQEMNREINTVGSKAQDAAIAARVVEIKAELEKIREQAQNIQ